MNLEIIKETSHYLLLNKPAGMIVEKSPFESPTVEDWVLRYLEQSQKKIFLGIVHRLDRVTSGVLIMAKKKSTLKYLNQQFAARKVKKQYLAIVENPPKLNRATLLHWLEKDQKNKRAVIHGKEKKNTTLCQLEYQVLATSSKGTLLSIQPSTGRFHQIRAQLAFVGNPIVGDKKYGANTTYYDRAIALQAHTLAFIDPLSGRTQVATAPMPNNEWWNEFRDQVPTLTLTDCG